jgi:hypothetical protein
MKQYGISPHLLFTERIKRIQIGWHDAGFLGGGSNLGGNRPEKPI